MTMVLYMVVWLFCCACAYLIGSMNFSLVISRRFYRKDIRRYGSHNAGMTNMLRTFGILPAGLTLLGDFCKGIFAILLGRCLLVWLLGAPDYQLMEGLIGISAMLGHLFPVFYRFKGGKGVLVCAGVILMINPWVFLTILGVFLLVFACFRIISLGSILAAIAFPVATAIINGLSHYSLFDYLSSIAVSVVISSLVLYMHRGNMKRLLHGEEPKVGKNKAE